jgi:hypothetical protein
MTKFIKWRDRNPGRFALIAFIFIILALGIAGESDYQNEVAYATQN